MGSDEALVRFEVRGHTAFVTLDREDRRNALDLRMMEALLEALDRAEQEPQVRVVCLTGAGDRVFCAGADLREFSTGSEGPRRFAALLKRLQEYPRPLVARLNGHCLGGGVGLALACDLAYARDDIEIGTPEARIGLFPMMIAPLLLRGGARSKVLEMVLTAGKVTAREAEAMGLLTRAVPAMDLDAVVARVLDAIAAAAPLALRMGREALREVQDKPFGVAMDLLCERLIALSATEDAAEGIRAMLERRAPTFKGR